MRKFFKGSVFVLLFFWAVLLPGISSAQDAQYEVAVNAPAVLQDAAAVEAFWTPERMKDAVPLDLEVVEPPQALETDSADILPLEPEAFIPGWNGKGPQPDAELIELDMGAAELDTRPPFSPPAHPRDFANYGPFQRYNFPGNYLRYPRSTVGKLYFVMDMNGDGTPEGTYFCTASVVGAKDLIFTAGHCVNNGLRGRGANNGWAYNQLFCPSWDNGTLWQGCWAADVYQAVSGWWYVYRNTDRDYGCMVTRTYGTRYSTSVGNRTGWLGMYFNRRTGDQVVAWGYPARSPFTGAKIINTIGTEWYEVNMNSSTSPEDGLASKYIGNDQHSGNSGGPWMIAYSHPALNYPDTDGSSWTNPGQSSAGWTYLVGLNSHMRCRTNCAYPPGATTGAFWQEEGGPRITSSASDNTDAYDVWRACYDNGGS